jgi:hypothetical protein
VGNDKATKAKKQISNTAADGKIFAQWMVNFLEMKR